MKLLDVTFYKNFHLDLKSMDLTNEQLIHHYNEYGSIEYRLSSEAEFYEFYSFFDLDFYNNYYHDVSTFNGNNYMLMWHYHNYGFKEGRISCEKDFYELYSDFDLDFYNNYYQDVSIFNGNKYMLMRHYHNYGFKEGRFSCEKDFYELYSDFDLDFYNNYHQDLHIFNKNKYILMRHYHDKGNKEDRIINMKKLKEEEKKTYLLNNFPILFNKYLLNLEIYDYPISYEIINESILTKKELCHIHCYKISFLPNMFDKIIDLLNIYYDIIVTYNIYD